MLTSFKALWIAVGAAILGLAGTSVYSLAGLKTQRNRAEDLATYNSALRDSLTQVQNQLQLVSEKLDAVTAEQKAASRAVEQTARTSRTAARTTTATVANDPRWKQFQDRISDQQKQLEGARKDLAGTREDLANTRQDVDKTRQEMDQARQQLGGRLDSTRDELSGSIARNHEELVALQKRGERNYAEFQLDKSKQFQKVGPVSLSVRKVDFKHKYYDLMLIVEDQQLEKKHVNLYEPVMIRLADRPQPLELVVNEISKNQVKGYVSAPKYKNSELAAAAVPAQRQ